MLFLLIFASSKRQKPNTMEKAMDKLTGLIIANDGLNETEAKAKLNLLYIKMNQSGIKSFNDEYIEWLMTEKKLNYKAILQTPDLQLHDIFDTEFKH
jgi:hypothetical protein